MNFARKTDKVFTIIYTIISILSVSYTHLRAPRD